MGLEILRTISDHSLLQEIPVSSDFSNGAIVAGVCAGVATFFSVAYPLYTEISQTIRDRRNARRIEGELYQLLGSGQPYTRPGVDKILGELSAAYYKDEMEELIIKARSQARTPEDLSL